MSEYYELCWCGHTRADHGEWPDDNCLDCPCVAFEQADDEDEDEEDDQ